MDRVGKPWSVQLELAEGCNRLCEFCGLNAIRDKPGNYKLMTIATAHRIGEELVNLCPEARYEFAMHGEPLQNTKALEIFRIFRAYLPKAQIQLTTNGKVLMRKMQQRVEAIFAAGVDYIIMDTYRPERDKLREEAATLTGIDVKDFYDELAPKGWSPWHNHRRSVKRLIVLMDDLGARSGEVGSRYITNHAGNNPKGTKLLEPLKKTCTLPFRELSINWNGDINICCNDWGHEYTCGNATRQTLSDIWYGAPFEAARKLLYQRNRGFSPCSSCDMRSGARAGLLPHYEAPTAADLEIVRKTVYAGTAINGHKAFLDIDLGG